MSFLSSNLREDGTAEIKKDRINGRWIRGSSICFGNNYYCSYYYYIIYIYMYYLFTLLWILKKIIIMKNDCESPLWSIIPMLVFICCLSVFWFICAHLVWTWVILFAPFGDHALTSMAGPGGCLDLDHLPGTTRQIFAQTITAVGRNLTMIR